MLKEINSFLLKACETATGIVIAVIFILAFFAVQAPAQTYTPDIGVNGAAPQDWNTDWPLADLNAVSRTQDSTAYAAWDRGQYLPAGIYTLHSEGGPTTQVSFGPTGLTIAAGQTKTIEINTPTGVTGNGFLITPPNADLRIYMPGSDGTTRSHPAWLDAIEPYSTWRVMDKQRTNGSSIINPADFPRISDGNYANRYPLALIIELAHEANVAAVWFCIPHQATDAAIADMANQITEAIEATSYPGKVYIEYSNEVWNSGFGQHTWVGDNFSNLGTRWERAWQGYGIRATQAMLIWQELRPDDVRVLAGQSANEWLTGEIIKHAKSVDGTLHFDAFAIAPYMQGDMVSSGGTEWKDRPIEDWVEAGWADLPRKVAQMQKQNTVITSHGLIMVGYEGGQHAAPWTATQKNDSAFVNKTVEYHAHPAQQAMHRDYLTAWFDTTPGVFVYFNHVSKHDKHGSWGITQSLTEDTARKRGIMEVLGTVPPIDPDPEPDPVDPCLDWNGDGILDQADIQKFVEAFVAATQDD